jgi:Ni,Fe-hydrogenase III small subunit
VAKKKKTDTKKTSAAQLSSAVQVVRALEDEDAVRLAAARDPLTPSATLEKLASDDDWEVRDAVALNPNTPLVTLEKLIAEDEDGELCVLVAGNPSTPTEILERSAYVDKWRVREAVAGNPSTPLTVLKRLADDNEWQEAEEEGELYHNTGILPPIEDGDRYGYEVRAAVAGNPSTPPELLEYLADAEWGVRIAVGCNPNTPSDVFKRLLNDDDWQVREALEDVAR